MLPREEGTEDDTTVQASTRRAEASQYEDSGSCRLDICTCMYWGWLMQCKR